MYSLLPNPQRDGNFADAFSSLINISLYNSNAAFTPLVYYLQKVNCPKIAGHILFFLSFGLPSYSVVSSYKHKVLLTHKHLPSQTDESVGENCQWCHFGLHWNPEVLSNCPPSFCSSGCWATRSLTESHQ